MTDRISPMPVAVINPWVPSAPVRYVMVADQYDASRVRENGWEFLRGFRMGPPMAEPVKDYDFPDPDEKQTHWYCDKCCVGVEIKIRCKHCGKRERDKS